MAKKYDETYDPSTGIKTVYKGDEVTGNLEQHFSQDVEPILKANKIKRNNFDGYNKDKSVKSIAEIPIVVLYQWLQEGDQFLFSMPPAEQHTYLRKKLNDPKWAYLKTSEGTY